MRLVLLRNRIKFVFSDEEDNNQAHEDQPSKNVFATSSSYKPIGSVVSDLESEYGMLYSREVAEWLNPVRCQALLSHQCDKKWLNDAKTFQLLFVICMVSLMVMIFLFPQQMM